MPQDRPERPRRPVSLPPDVIAELLSREDLASEHDLQVRLSEALAQLPAEQRTAVVAAHGYAEGAVGAAMELGVEPARAQELAEEGLALLRAAMAPRS